MPSRKVRISSKKKHKTRDKPSVTSDSSEKHLKSSSRKILCCKKKSMSLDPMWMDTSREVNITSLRLILPRSNKKITKTWNWQRHGSSKSADSRWNAKIVTKNWGSYISSRLNSRSKSISWNSKLNPCKLSSITKRPELNSYSPSWKVISSS